MGLGKSIKVKGVAVAKKLTLCSNGFDALYGIGMHYMNMNVCKSNLRFNIDY